MARATPRIETRSPTRPAYRRMVDARKHEAMKRLVLKATPRSAPGITQNGLFERLEKSSPRDVFPGTTYGWWGKTVQLDLEARGVLRCDRTSRPLRWRRVK